MKRDAFTKLYREFRLTHGRPPTSAEMAFEICPDLDHENDFYRGAWPGFMLGAEWDWALGCTPDPRAARREHVAFYRTMRGDRLP